jgi:hypothetical protein
MTAFLKTWRGKIITVVLALLFIVALYVVYVFWQLNQVFPKNINFDAALWQTSTSDGQDTPRCLMRNDLEQNHLKFGMTRVEVNTLLGETQSNGKVLNYYLGFCNPFGIDGESLALEFDDGDKLIHVRTIQH